MHNIGDYLQIILAVWLTAGLRTKIWFTAGSQRRLRYVPVQSVYMYIFTCETSHAECMFAQIFLQIILMTEVVWLKGLTRRIFLCQKIFSTFCVRWWFLMF